MKRYTHFWDKEDGSGNYRDYASLTTVLNRHSKVIKQPGVTRSWITDYGSDGTGGKRIADWSPASSSMSPEA